MEKSEQKFALVISAAHGMDHFLKRVFPPLVPIWAVFFGIPLWKLGVILGARTFGSAIAQAPMGYLSDHYDRRLLLPVGIFAMGVSFIVISLVPDLGVSSLEISLFGESFSGVFIGMVLAMVIAGIGSSTLHPTGYPLITQNVGAERKGKVLGMWGSARSFGDGLAPAIVGVVLLLMGWQAIVAGFGVVGMVYACYLFVTLGSFNTTPAKHASSDGESADGARSIRQRDNREYIYPLLAVFVTFVLLIIATTGANVFITEFITSEYGFSFSVAGFDVTPASTASFYYSALLITAGVVQLGVGDLTDRYDHRKVLMGFAAVGGLTLLLLAAVPLSPLFLLLTLVLMGASLWALNPARDALVSDISPPELEGRTFGYLWTGALLISSGAPAVVGYIGDVASIREAFTLLSMFVFLAIVPVALLLSDRVYLEDGAEDTATAD